MVVVDAPYGGGGVHHVLAEGAVGGAVGEALSAGRAGPGEAVVEGVDADPDGLGALGAVVLEPVVGGSGGGPLLGVGSCCWSPVGVGAGGRRWRGSRGRRCWSCRSVHGDAVDGGRVGGPWAPGLSGFCGVRGMRSSGAWVPGCQGGRRLGPEGGGNLGGEDARCHGPEDARGPGGVGVRVHGSGDAKLPGCLEARGLGGVGVRVQGSGDEKMPGCLEAGCHGPEDGESPGCVGGRCHGPEGDGSRGCSDARGCRLRGSEVRWPGWLPGFWSLALSGRLGSLYLRGSGLWRSQSLVLMARVSVDWRVHGM